MHTAIFKLIREVVLVGIIIICLPVPALSHLFTKIVFICIYVFSVLITNTNSSSVNSSS